MAFVKSARLRPRFLTGFGRQIFGAGLLIVTVATLRADVSARRLGPGIPGADLPKHWPRTR